MTSDIWEGWEYATESNRDDVERVDSFDGVEDVEVVEGICYCAMHEPGLADTVWRDQVLFV